MKRHGKRLCSVLLAAVMLLSLLPVEAAAQDIDTVTVIETAEDFFAIMDDPAGTYRLENDLDLGWIAPLGWSPESTVSFMGILDGNGHTVRFAMGNTDGCQQYGLFYSLYQAEITDLQLDVQIELSGNLTHAGTLMYYASDSRISGVTITGSLCVSGDGSQGLCVAGMAPNESQNDVAAVTVDLRTEVSMPNEQLVWYHALGNGQNHYRCDVYGSIRLTGGKVNARGFLNASESVFAADLSIESAFGGTVILDQNGVNNYIATDVAMQPHPDATADDGLYQSFTGLSGSKGSSFVGTLNVWGKVAAGASISMARNCENVYIEGDINVDSWGEKGAALNVLQNCMDSIATGTVQTNMSSGSVALMDRGEGNYFYGTALAYGTGIVGIYYGSNNTLEADLYGYRYDEGEITVQGISGGTYHSFFGSAYAEGERATVHGSSCCNNSTVCADLTANGWAASQGYGTTGGTECYYRGEIRAENIKVMSGNSYAEADLYGSNIVVVTDGENSCFTGSIYAEQSAIYDNARVDVRLFGECASCYANAEIVIKGGDYGALVSTERAGCGFAGTVSMSTNKGSLNVIGDTPVELTHYATGFSGTSNGKCVSYYKGGCTSSNHEHPYFIWEGEERPCNYYETFVYSFSNYPNAGSGAMDGWDGAIDPEAGTFRPEKTPASYTLRLVSQAGVPLADARLTLNGAEYYTDEAGRVYLEDGPTSISPLKVAIKSGEGYMDVMTRRVYYPIADTVNDIVLTPQIDLDITTLASPNAEQTTGTGSGVGVSFGDRNAEVVKLPIDIALEAALKSAKLEYEYDRSTGHIYIGIGAQRSGGNTWIPGHYSKDRSIPNLLNALNEVNPDDPYDVRRATEGLQERGMRLFGLEGEVKLLGAAEFGFPREGFTLYDACLVLGGKAEGRWVFPVAATPLYSSIGVKLELEGKLHLKESFKGVSEELALQSDGTISGSGRVEGTAGVGLRTAKLYAELGIGGEIDGTLELPNEGVNKSVRVNGVFDVFGEVGILGFRNRVSLTEYRAQLWPQTRQADLRSLLQGQELTIASRSNQRSGSAYPYSEVALYPLADGRWLLVYTDDDLSRGDADCSTLCMRIGTEQDGQLVWGNRMIVENDGTGDYGFDVCVSGNTAAVVWQDVDRTFGDGEGLQPVDMTTHVGLTQALVDCSGDVPVTKKTATLNSGSNSFEYLPYIFFDGERVRTAWVTSTNNDPMTVVEGETETVWLSEDFGQAGRAVASKQPLISGVALTSDSLLWVAGEEDEQGLWHCDRNGEVYEVQHGSIMQLQSCQNRFCYTVDEQLWYGEGSWDNRWVAEEGVGVSNLLHLSADGSVYAGQPGPETSRICRLEGGKALPIGEYDGFLSSWDAANGYLVTLAREGFDENDSAHLTTEHEAPVEAIEVEEALCDNPAAAPNGWVNFSIPVYNDGYYAIDSLPVTVTAQDGTVLFEEELGCWIEQGSKEDIQFGFAVPEGYQAQEITITVRGESQTMLFGCTNLAVDAEWKNYRAGGVNAWVENTGIGTASGTVTLTDESGRVLGVQEVTVEEGQTEELWFDFGGFYTETANLTVTLDETENALISEDNVAYVTVSPEEARLLRVPADMVLTVGEQCAVEISAKPDGALLPEVSYRSENTKIARVDENGTVTAVAAGETEIVVSTAKGTEYRIAVLVQKSQGEPDNPTEPEMPCDGGADCPSRKFVDVNTKEWYHPYVDYAVTHGLFGGTSANTFEPETAMTRAMLVTVLWRYEGQPKGYQNTFSDVNAKNGSWYIDAVAWASANGVVNGVGNGRFDPDGKITREQMATILFRYAQKKGIDTSKRGNLSGFPDADKISDYAKEAVYWTVGEGIINGSDGKLLPQGNATRAQVATILMRYIENIVNK
ncbi:MAG: S-layer homology domain-containing protein [Faecousia sp.]